MGAEQRWADHLDVAADIDYDGTVLAGPAVWRISADSPDGFNMAVYGRSGMIEGNLGMDEAEVHIRGLHWNAFSPEYSGEVRVDVECGGPCDFSVAREENGSLPEITGLNLRYRDADARFDGSLDDEFGSHDFELPEGVERLRYRVSAYAPDDWYRMTITDSDGDSFASLRFPGVSMDDMDLAFQVEAGDDDALPAGTWNLLVTCEGACEYNYGFYW